MPYKLKKARGKDLYWVVNKESGEKYSKDPLPHAKAVAQMRALYVKMGEEQGLKGGAMLDWLKKRLGKFFGIRRRQVAPAPTVKEPEPEENYHIPVMFQAKEPSFKTETQFSTDPDLYSFEKDPYGYMERYEERSGRQNAQSRTNTVVPSQKFHPRDTAEFVSGWRHDDKEKGAKAIRHHSEVAEMRRREENYRKRGPYFPPQPPTPPPEEVVYDEWREPPPIYKIRPYEPHMAITKSGEVKYGPSKNMSKADWTAQENEKMLESLKERVAWNKWYYDLGVLSAPKDFVPPPKYSAEGRYKKKKFGGGKKKKISGGMATLREAGLLSLIRGKYGDNLKLSGSDGNDLFNWVSYHGAHQRHSRQILPDEVASFKQPGTGVVVNVLDNPRWFEWFQELKEDAVEGGEEEAIDRAIQKVAPGILPDKAWVKGQEEAKKREAKARGKAEAEARYLREAEEADRVRKAEADAKAQKEREKADEVRKAREAYEKEMAGEDEEADKAPNWSASELRQIEKEAEAEAEGKTAEEVQMKGVEARTELAGANARREDTRQIWRKITILDRAEAMLRGREAKTPAGKAPKPPEAPKKGPDPVREAVRNETKAERKRRLADEAKAKEAEEERLLAEAMEQASAEKGIAERKKQESIASEASELVVEAEKLSAVLRTVRETAHTERERMDAINALIREANETQLGTAKRVEEAYRLVNMTEEPDGGFSYDKGLFPNALAESASEFEEYWKRIMGDNERAIALSEKARAQKKAFLEDQTKTQEQQRKTEADFKALQKRFGIFEKKYGIGAEAFLIKFNGSGRYKPGSRRVKETAIVGSGLWDTIRDAFNPRKVIHEIVNPDSILRRRVSDVSKGVRKDYPPSSRATIERYGEWKINGLQIRRDPIQSAIHTAFNVLSFGAWDKARQAENFDRLFHLGLVINLHKDGRNHSVLAEKNEVINIGETKPRQSDSEIINTPHPYDNTLKQFLDKGLEMAGTDAYFLYDPFQRNCQDFVMGLLKANGVLTSKAQKFIKQDVESIVKRLPDYVAPIAKGITDIGAIANMAFEGAGRHSAVSATRLDPPSKFKNQLEKAGLSPSAYLQEAQRRAKKHHYPYKLLGFASDGVHKLAIPDENGRVVAFGRVGYGDHLIYSHLEAHGKVSAGTAQKKQDVFQKSHTKIKGDWQKNPFSPNNLALKVLW